MDGRRRQWITWDVFFNDGPLGVAIRERFGVCGITLFQSFLSACKKSSVQGQMSYASVAGALETMGLPDLRLVNEKGEEWTLDEFWTFLGQRKQIRRTRRGRVTNVVSTRWKQWQRAPGGSQNRKSGGQIVHELAAYAADDNDPDIDPDPDIESDNDPDSAHEFADTPMGANRGSSGKGISLEGEGQTGELARMLAAACTARNRKLVASEAADVVALCRPHAPLSVLDAAVRATLKNPEPPVLPRAMLESFKRECRKRGLPAPLLPEIGRAS